MAHSGSATTGEQREDLKRLAARVKPTTKTSGPTTKTSARLAPVKSQSGGCQVGREAPGHAKCQRLKTAALNVKGRFWSMGLPAHERFVPWWHLNRVEAFTRTTVTALTDNVSKENVTLP